MPINHYVCFNTLQAVVGILPSTCLFLLQNLLLNSKLQSSKQVNAAALCHRTRASNLKLMVYVTQRLHLMYHGDPETGLLALHLAYLHIHLNTSCACKFKHIGAHLLLTVCATELGGHVSSPESHLLLPLALSQLKHLLQVSWLVLPLFVGSTRPTQQHPLQQRSFILLDTSVPAGTCMAGFHLASLYMHTHCHQPSACH